MPARRIALALGDPHGIGPEIALRALAELTPAQRARVAVFGPGSAWQEMARRCGLEALAAGVSHREAGSLAQAPRWGLVHADAGRSAVQSATAALLACRSGEFDAVIACPHHETAIHQAGLRFSGYPSLVAQVCGLPEDDVFLVLVGGGLRIVHATLHESVATALGRLTPSLVQRAAQAGLRACALAGIAAPRVGLMGINPHASEDGLFGDEDRRITLPAAEALRAQGVAVDGPLGGDLLLSQRRHDLYVAIFHDQGHIPVKLLAPQAASALSVGADALLSSVGHGCAMDIAGQGVADAGAVLRTWALLTGETPGVDSVDDASTGPSGQTAAGAAP